MVLKPNKKPRNDGKALAGNSSNQGSEITMDSNANHRHRITSFSTRKQQSKAMSQWLYVHKDKAPLYSAEQNRLGYYASSLGGCASWLLFKHYYTLDKYKLDKFISCKKHMLCSFCSALRGSKQAKAYHDKAKAIMQEKPHLKLVFITLTLKNGDDFLERFNHLEQSFQTLKDRRRDYLKKGRGFNEFCKIDGCVYSYEVTKKSNGWHPHLHIVALVDDWIDREKLSKEWEAITGDSKIIDVRRIKPDASGDYMDAFMECFKYCMKFSEMSKEHIWEVHEKLSPEKVNSQGIAKRRLKRLHGSLGSFRGIVVPDELTDDKEETVSDNTPFMAILYSYKNSAYSVLEMKDFPYGQVSNDNMLEALEDLKNTGETLISLQETALAVKRETTTRRSCDDVEECRANQLLEMPDWVLVFENYKKELLE